jgi:hypothetical protein
MLRGATRGAGADGMNTTEILIGGYRAGLMQPTEDSPTSKLMKNKGHRCYLDGLIKLRCSITPSRFFKQIPVNLHWLNTAWIIQSHQTNFISDSILAGNCLIRFGISILLSCIQHRMM